MYEKIYGDSYICKHCGSRINIVNINENTVVKEFAENYYLKSTCKDGHCSSDERFCILVRYDDFIENPDEYINKAYDKVDADINRYVHWKDIKHIYKKQINEAKVF